MSYKFSKPGPIPTSCLTCRQRRKKCDLSKPRCERCLKSGFVCLGYEDSNSRARARREAPGVSTRQSGPALVEADGLQTPNSLAFGLSQHKPGLSEIGLDDIHRPSILGAAMLYGKSGAVSSPDEDSASLGSPEDFDRSWPQEQSQMTVYSRSRIRHPSCAGQVIGTASSTESPRKDRSSVIKMLHQSTPPVVDVAQIVREDHVMRVINEYHLQRSSCWFMPPSPSIRRMAVTMLMGSKRMTWTMYMGARLFQALSQESWDTVVRRRAGWIDALDQKFTIGVPVDPPLSDITDRLKVQLELAFFKFTLVDNASGYALLRKVVPRFLQLVAADPNLYVEQPNDNLVVSFPLTLRAPWYELERFIIYDATTSLVLGLPPLVEYGYDGECNFSSQLEWIHGIPASLVGTISQVNSWRAGSKIPPIDWQTLESRVLAWQPPSVGLDRVPATECTSGARVAIQESWRHVALIYIYMGMCGVSSDDSRVQASVHRIFQLGEMVDHQSIGINLFAHWVVAGLAARLEKHRMVAYEQLLSFQGTRVWLFRGPQFSQTLYHLWHGVGSGGAPVVWDDYVQSRCEVVPIP